MKFPKLLKENDSLITYAFDISEYKDLILYNNIIYPAYFYVNESWLSKSF